MRGVAVPRMRVAYAIAATFTAKTGLSLFLQLSRQDADKYDEEACRRMLDYCYAHTNGQLTLGTIVYLARRAGYQMPGKPLQYKKHTKMTVKEVIPPFIPGAKIKVL